MTTAQRQLSVIVPLLTSSAHVSDLLWSVLREHSLSLDVVVAVDSHRHHDLAALVGTVVSADTRVHVVNIDATRGFGAAVAAALGQSSGGYVTVADPDGLCVEGGYESLVAALEISGSDISVGAAASPTGHRRRVTRALDGALDTDAHGVRLSERPGLIAEDRLCTMVIRRAVLESVVGLGEGCSKEMVAAAALATARRIDVLSRAVVFCRGHQKTDLAASDTRGWIADRLAIRAGLATASVRECYARAVLLREILENSTLDSILSEDDLEAISDFVRDFALDLRPTSLSNLSILKRWRLALIALGQTSLGEVTRQRGRRLNASDVPEFDTTRLGAGVWASLCLGKTDPRTGFIERFVDRSPMSSDHPFSKADEIEISIVIPTHNVVSYVDELLHSIRASIGVRIEIIVVDDGSTDGTWDRVVAHQQADPRVRPVRSPGVGGGQARELGIGLARGEYLAFADGDDLVPPRAYARMLSIARRSEADVVSGSYLKFFSTSTWDASSGYNDAYALPAEGVSLDYQPQLVRHRAVWNRLIRRQHWVDTSFPFPGVPRSNDIVAMTSVLMSARRLAVTPVHVYVYRDRPGTGSMTSAAGSVDYTVSYLSEEVTCAILVEQSRSEPVAREYWAMVLRSDAWKNLGLYIEQRSDVGEADRRVAEQIARLLSRAPRVDFDAIPPESQAVWALSAAGRFDEARTILLAAKSSDETRLASLVDAIATAAEITTLPRWAVADLARRYLVRRIISDRAWDTADFEFVLPVLRRLLTDVSSALAAVPMALEGRLVRAVLDREDPGVMREALSLNPVGIPALLRTDGRRTTITCTRFDVQRGPARLVARQYGDRDRLRVHVSQIPCQDARWSVTVDPSRFPRSGLWVLEVEYEDRWGMRRSPLNLKDVTSRAIPLQLRRVIAVRSRKNRSLIRLTEPMLVRVRKKAKQVFAV